MMMTTAQVTGAPVEWPQAAAVGKVFALSRPVIEGFLVPMPLEITQDVAIPDSDIQLSFVRASGPGGQNVNKVASAVQLRFNLQGSALDERVKLRLRALAGRRVTDDGAILIIARNHRTQDQNRREAHERLAELVRQALIEPKTRRATKPTRASKERRLAGKDRKQRTKSLRGKVRWDD